MPATPPMPAAPAAPPTELQGQYNYPVQAQPAPAPAPMAAPPMPSVAMPAPPAAVPMPAAPPLVRQAPPPVAIPPIQVPAVGGIDTGAMINQAINAGNAGSLGAINFAGVETSVNRLLPNNLQYEAIITKAVEGKAANGNAQLVITLRITHAMSTDGQVVNAYRGTTLTDFLSYQDSALWRVKSLLEACELCTPEGRFAGQSVNDFVDYIVAFRVADSEWNNVTRSKVSGTYSAGIHSPELQGGPVG